MENKREKPNKNVNNVCPWCGQQGWRFVEKDIGTSSGWFCDKCGYTKKDKK